MVFYKLLDTERRAQFAPKKASWLLWKWSYDGCAIPFFQFIWKFHVLSKCFRALYGRRRAVSERNSQGISSRRSYLGPSSRVIKWLCERYNNQAPLLVHCTTYIVGKDPILNVRVDQIQAPRKSWSIMLSNEYIGLGPRKNLRIFKPTERQL